MTLSAALERAIITDSLLVVTPNTLLSEFIQTVCPTPTQDICAVVRTVGEAPRLLRARDLLCSIAAGRCIETLSVAEVPTRVVPVLLKQNLCYQSILNLWQAYDIDYLLIQDDQGELLGWVTPQSLLYATQQEGYFKGQLVEEEQGRAFKSQRETERLISLIASRIRSSFSLESILNAATVEIEERQKAEAQLLANEAFLQSIFQGVSNPIFVIDVSLDQKFHYMAFNPECEQCTGLQTVDIQGKTPECIFPAEVATAVSANYERCLQLATAITYEESLNFKGQDQWWLTTLNPLQDATSRIYQIVGTSINITERKHAEVTLQQLNLHLEQCIEKRTEALQESQQALQESEQFLRSILEGVENPIFVVDVLDNGNFCYASLNPASEKFLGVKNTEIAGKTIQEIFGYTQGVAIQERFRHCVDQGKPQIYEERYLVREQEFYWLTTINLLRNKTGKIYRLVGTSYNITERRYAEDWQRQHMAELIEWQNRYDAVSRACGQIIYEWNLSTNQPIWGANTKEILGYQLAEMPYGLNAWVELVHPDDFQTFMEALNVSISQKKPLRVEYRLRRKDNTYLWVEDRNLLFKDRKGEFVRVMGFISDINARKQFEAALSRSELKFRNIFENSQIGIFRTSIEDGLILDANQRFVEMAGYQSAADLIGKKQTTEFYADPLARQRMVSKLKECGALDNIEIEYRQRDGTTRWGLASIRLNSQENCLEGVLADISARKQAEEQLRYTNEQLSLTNAELARMTRLKDEFLANMSHELRTPLNAILGFSQILLDEGYGLLNDKQKKTIATIERSGNHLLELINDILDLAKIEAGKFELQITNVSVKNLCESSLGFVKQLALTKNIQLSIHGAEIVGKISIDDRRMRQVLINLLSNAVKFTPEGGNVSLRVQPDPSHQCLGLSVVDTGIGIASNDLDKLFQPFVQIDSSLNRQYTGTGLGLALVHSIVELHGGRVTVTSEVGKGSCFTVELPWQAPIIEDDSEHRFSPSEARIKTSQPTRIARSPLVLLAEDNSVNVEVLSDYLGSQGYHLIVAQNGREAVKMATQQEPQLILMDIQMPVMDGLEAIQLIRTHQRLATVPIIALTALAMPLDHDRCLAAGANQFITKPINLRQLSDVMQALLDV
jgi:PAS domain S-box-containing protein